jgi:hypothetical protein
MRRSRRIAILISLSLSLGLLLSAQPTAAAKPKPTACGPGQIDVTLRMPADGMVSYQEFTLTDDCQLIAGPAQELSSDQLPAATASESRTFASVGEAMPADGVGTQAITGSGCCNSAYAVQRTYDQGGIPGSLLLNEYWTEFDFNRCSGGLCSPYIRSWAAQDGGKWHREGPFGCCGGWEPNSSDHWLYRTGGGLGYTSVSISGHQGYRYEGVFDHSGNDYYNSYTNNFTGQYGGSWSCSLTKYWKKSLAFKLQAWCGTGNYGEK